MYIFPYLLVVVFLMARGNAQYHSLLLFKKYITIKNKTLANILIKQSPIIRQVKNDESHPNKLTYSGIVFYCLFLVLCCFSVVMVLLPEIPCESFIQDPRYIFLAGDTLNQTLPFVFAVTLIFASAAFQHLNTAKYAGEKTILKKTASIFYYLLFILSSSATVFGLWLALTTIIKTI